MSNDYYNATTTISRLSKSNSTALNSVLAAIAAGFEKLPDQLPLLQDRVSYAADAGSANAISISFTPAVAAYVDGSTFRTKLAATNTSTSVTFNAGAGARSVVLSNGAAPAAGDLVSGAIYEFTYDSALNKFRVMTPVALTSSNAPIVGSTRLTRAQLVSLASTFAVGTVVFVQGGLAFEYDGSSSAISDMPGWAPLFDVKFGHFSSLTPLTSKANADASSDDFSTALQAAVDYAGTNKINKVGLPSGYLRLEDEILVTSEDFLFEGVGMDDAILYIAHMGTGIRFRDRGARLERVKVLGYDARDPSLIATLGDFEPECIGIRLEIEDLALGSTLERTRDFHFSDYEVRTHHVGVALIGAVTGRSVNHVISNCGIGVAPDKGTLVGRTNLDTTPLATFENGEISNCPIHAVCSGFNNYDQPSPTIRFRLINVDGISGCATNSTLRMAPAQIFLRGADCLVSQCIISCDDLDDLGNPVAPIAFAGTDMQAVQNRYLECSPTLPLVYVYSVDALPTRGIVVDGGQVTTSSGTSVASVIEVDKHPLGDGAGGVATTEPEYPISVINIAPVEYDEIVTVGSNIGAAGFNRAGGFIGTPNCPPIISTSTVSRTSTTTLADHTELRAWLEVDAAYEFDLSFEYDGPIAADVKLNFTPPTGSTVTFGPAGNCYFDATGAAVFSAIGTADLVLGGNGSNNWVPMHIRGRVTSPSTAGYLTLQFAQNTSNGTACRIRLGSSLRVRRIKT